MAKNFLAVSPSFVAEMKETKAKINRMAMFDEIFLFLDDNYETELPHAEILRILNEKGFSYSMSVLRNFLKIIRVTKDFLSDKSENKIADFVNYFNETATRRGYTRFVNIGISCFIADKITGWEKVEELMNAEKKLDTNIVNEIVKDLKDGKKQYVADEVNATDAQLPIPDNFSNIIEMLKQEYDSVKILSNKLQEELSMSLEKCEELQMEHRECLEELKGLRNIENANAELQARLTEAAMEKDIQQKTIEVLKKEKKNIESLIARLKQEIEELKKTDIHKVCAMLTSLTEKGLEREDQAKIIGNGKEKFRNSDLLPKVFKPKDNDISYSKTFVDRFNDLDRTVAKNILKTILSISSTGLDSVSSSNKKVIQNCAEGTPDKSTQVTIKKYRMMCKISSQVLYFYDVFHRKNSPYAS